MATKRHRLLVSFTEEEFARVVSLGEQLKLSKSELLRRLVLAERLPKAEDFVARQSILDLMKVNADQARLGNLFKLALDEPLSQEMFQRLHAIIADIRETQADLKAIARAIHAIISPRRS